MKSRVFMLMGSIVCLAVTLGMPSAAKAQGEAAEVGRMFKACTESGGTAASNQDGRSEGDQLVHSDEWPGRT